MVETYDYRELLNQYYATLAGIEKQADKLTALIKTKGLRSDEFNNIQKRRETLFTQARELRATIRNIREYI